MQNNAIEYETKYETKCNIKPRVLNLSQFLCKANVYKYTDVV